MGIVDIVVNGVSVAIMPPRWENDKRGAYMVAWYKANTLTAFPFWFHSARFDPSVLTDNRMAYLEHAFMGEVRAHAEGRKNNCVCTQNRDFSVPCVVA